MSKPVATGRPLRFNTIDEALAEALRLAAAEREGGLTQLGTWTLGQTLGHLATWASFALDGYPDNVRAPLPVRLIVRLFRNRIINKAMPVGMKIRGVAGGTVGTELLTTDDGMSRFQDAMERLRRTAPSEPNPLLGRLTHDEWIQLNLRHAELHLGFLATP
jgi:hypothetical protein